MSRVKGSQYDAAMTSSLSVLKVGQEAGHETPNVVADLLERLNDSLPEQWPFFVENYVKANAGVHVHIGIQAAQSGLCFAFTNQYPLRYSRGRFVYRPSLPVNKVDGNLGNRHVDASVLVPITEYVQEGKRILPGVSGWPSVERLQLLDECLRSWRDVPDPALSFRRSHGAFDEDRELGAICLLLCHRADQSTGKIVESRPEVVDAVPDDQRELLVESSTGHVKDVMAAVMIELAGNRIRTTIGYPLDRNPHSLQVLVRSPEPAHHVPEEMRHAELSRSIPMSHRPERLVLLEVDRITPIGTAP
jgi:hypothetical protein